MCIRDRYGIEHKSPQFIEEAVYGLCEINRDKITEKTRLVANPGCYTKMCIRDRKMPGSKGLSPHELAHRWLKDLRTRPDMSIKAVSYTHLCNS